MKKDVTTFDLDAAVWSKIWISKYQEGVRISLMGLTLTHVSVCPKIGPRFPTSLCSGIFKLNDLMWEVIRVRFIEIGRIVDQYWLNFYS